VLTTASAQLGGFLLSMGNANIDLGGATSQFTLEIAGNLGSRELTFSSGTSVADMITTINTFTDVTGVEATASGASGIRVESTEYGSNEFVSVKIINDGGIVGANGIYELSAGDTDVADTGTAVAFTATGATNGLTDFGQDVEATINGIKAVTNGTTARINTDFLDVEIDLAYDTSTASAASSLVTRPMRYTVPRSVTTLIRLASRPVFE